MEGACLGCRRSKVNAIIPTGMSQSIIQISDAITTRDGIVLDAAEDNPYIGCVCSDSEEETNIDPVTYTRNTRKINALF